MASSNTSGRGVRIPPPAPFTMLIIAIIVLAYLLIGLSLNLFLFKEKFGYDFFSVIFIWPIILWAVYKMKF
jgi:ABC-type sugar transport system permease subunit